MRKAVQQQDHEINKFIVLADLARVVVVVVVVWTRFGCLRFAQMVQQIAAETKTAVQAGGSLAVVLMIAATAMGFSVESVSSCLEAVPVEWSALSSGFRDLLVVVGSAAVEKAAAVECTREAVTTGSAALFGCSAHGARARFQIEFFEETLLDWRACASRRCRFPSSSPSPGLPTPSLSSWCAQTPC